MDDNIDHNIYQKNVIMYQGIIAGFWELYIYDNSDIISIMYEMINKPRIH